MSVFWYNDPALVGVEARRRRRRVRWNRLLRRDTLGGVSVNVGAAQVVKLIENVLSEREETVRNDGPDPVFVSKDPQLVAAGATAWQVAANASQDVTLAPGEALYAICAAGKTAAVDLI